MRALLLLALLCACVEDRVVDRSTVTAVACAGRYPECRFALANGKRGTFYGLVVQGDELCRVEGKAGGCGRKFSRWEFCK